MDYAALLESHAQQEQQSCFWCNGCTDEPAGALPKTVTVSADSETKAERTRRWLKI